MTRFIIFLKKKNLPVKSRSTSSGFTKKSTQSISSRLSLSAFILKFKFLYNVET
jgi:hypothetical protein